MDPWNPANHPPGMVPIDPYRPEMGYLHYIPGYHAWPGGPPVGAIYQAQADAAHRQQPDGTRHEEAQTKRGVNLLLLAP